MARRAIPHRQRIGPQIRVLRQRNNMTLDELALAANLSASHLSRLERSQTLPSFTVLAHIAQALGTSIDEFVKLERDLEVLDGELSEQMNLFPFDKEMREEILNLSIDTRRALSETLRELSESHMTSYQIQMQVCELIRNHGLTSSWDQVGSLITSEGLNAIGLSRAFIRLVETPGTRQTIMTSRTILPLAPEVNIACLYQQHYPDQPLDPGVAGWWDTSEKIEGDNAPVNQWPAQVIVEADSIEAWIANPDKDWKQYAASNAINVVRHWKDRLKSDDQFQLAVTYRDLGRGNFLAVRNSCALFEMHPQSREKATAVRCGLWLGGEHVHEISSSFEREWNGLSNQETDQNAVNEWLEQQIEFLNSVAQPESR